MVKRLPAMQGTRVRSLGWEDLLEKEMATHSSILAWRIPWVEERGRLQFMGPQKVGHDWASLHFTSLNILMFISVTLYIDFWKSCLFFFLLTKGGRKFVTLLNDKKIDRICSDILYLILFIVNLCLFLRHQSSYSLISCTDLFPKNQISVSLISSIFHIIDFCFCLYAFLLLVLGLFCFSFSRLLR